jgi:succinate dehydrogenase / fumarate reductase cytochrome b subunit
MIAFFFILFHLWQLHYLGKLAGGGAFDAEHAASSTAIALGPVYWKIVYVIGTLAVVYHFSNGLWTFGITWGIWTSDRAQRGAGYVCAAFGVLLAFVGMGALYGMSTVNVPQAETIENRMEQTREMSEGKIAAHAAGPTQSNNQPPEKQN